MDSLTQIVLGASLGEAVLGRKIGNKAMLWGAIAGTIPDLDVFLKFITDDITSTEMHRGFSHSLLFCIIMAPLLGWLVNKIYQKKEATQKNWTWLFFWCLVTHPLLDMHTTWGTQFFWPFEYRVAYKNIFVADPLYTIPFLILVLAAMFYKRTNPKRRKINNLALIISTSYMLLTVAFKSIAYYNFNKALRTKNIDYIEMDTKPTPLNSILWNAQVETKNGYLSGYYSLFDSKTIYFLKEIPKNHHLLNPYRDQKVVKQLMKISVGWYYLKKLKDGLLYTDIRFGQIGFDDDATYMWKYKLTIDNNSMLHAKRITFKPEGNIMSKALNELFERIKGN
jgi:inner membrane protein